MKCAPEDRANEKALKLRYVTLGKHSFKWQIGATGFSHNLNFQSHYYIKNQTKLKRKKNNFFFMFTIWRFNVNNRTCKFIVTVPGPTDANQQLNMLHTNRNLQQTNLQITLQSNYLKSIQIVWLANRYYNHS